eukprot:SAG11_NODE_501_length_8895_cov_12.129832_8_plen_95_part_00
MPASRLHARNGGINFSKFLYVRDFPEYPYSIARMQANTVSLLRSRKTYSRYLKKIPPSENLSLFGPTQYMYLHVQLYMHLHGVGTFFEYKIQAR